MAMFNFFLMSADKGGRSGELSLNTGKFTRAFSIESFSLIVNGLFFPLEFNHFVQIEDDKDNEITGVSLRIEKEFFNEIDKLLPQISRYELSMQISYFGIKDYSLLFPFMENTKLTNRLALFYEEAEEAFKNKSWLSFALMAGAVFEGVLYDLIGEDLGFDKLIKKAEKLGYIYSEMSDIFHLTRNARNLVHGKKFEKNYISRKNAFEIHETLLKTLSIFENRRYDRNDRLNKKRK